MKLQGLRTVIYRTTAKDLQKTKEWYTRFLGQKPYFDEPFYVGFNVAGYELGLDPDETKPPKVGDNVQTYWGVKDVEKSFAEALEAGAKEYMAPRAVGGDIKVAVVKDPFGNLVGLIENPSFKAE